MSSSSYSARHRAPGRHRAPRTHGLPRALTPQFLLPTAAAATLVLTTTGATMAGSAPLELQTASIDVALAQSQVSENRSDVDALAERRTQTTGQTAALQGREQLAERVARETERQALAAKQAEEAKKKAAEAKKKAAEAQQKAEEEARQATQGWVLPMSGYNFTSGFGSRWGRLHAGVDLAAPVGTPIYSVSSGVVLRASNTGSCGNNVWVEHWDGAVTRYCHMDYMSVTPGQRVGPGDKLGGNGNTGRSYGPHLHFEVRPGGENADPVDPIGWLSSKGLGL